MSDDYAQKPTQEYGTTRGSSSTGNSIQNLLVTLSVAGLWLLVTAAAPQGGGYAPAAAQPAQPLIDLLGLVDDNGAVAAEAGGAAARAARRRSRAGVPRGGGPAQKGGSKTKPMPL